MAQRSLSWIIAYKIERLKFHGKDIWRQLVHFLVRMVERVWGVRILTASDHHHVRVFSLDELLLAVHRSHRKGRFTNNPWVDDFQVIDTMKCLGVSPGITKARLHDLTQRGVLRAGVASDGQVTYPQHAILCPLQ